jgi:hypothetical protein
MSTEKHTPNPILVGLTVDYSKARLFAAAPDMLRALQLALRDAEKGGFCQQTFDDVRAAIARATGGA